MTYEEWFLNQGKEHQKIITKLKDYNINEIIDYFKFENMVINEPNFCLLYKENKKNSFNCNRSLEERAPNRKVGLQPAFASSTPNISIGAVPTPPPTSKGLNAVTSLGIVNPLPKGITTLTMSPCFTVANLRVPSPTNCTRNHTSFVFLST